MNLEPSLIPDRSDIQGAIEFAYRVLLANEHSNETTAVGGSVVLGPALWIAYTYDYPEVIGWLINPPDAETVEKTWRTLSARTDELADFQNAWSRLTPFIAQDTPRTKALLSLFTQVLPTHEAATQ